MQDIVVISEIYGYNVNMSRNVEKKSKQILLNLSPSDYEQFVRVAEETDRPLGYVARELSLRGLMLYELDGKLRGEAPRSDRKLAPVVARIEPGLTKKDVQKMLDRQDETKPRRTTKIPVGGKAR
jgi:hypothetical protein